MMNFFFLYGIILNLKFRAIFLQISHASTDIVKQKKSNHMILNKLKKDPQKQKKFSQHSNFFLIILLMITHHDLFVANFYIKSTPFLCMHD